MEFKAEIGRLVRLLSINSFDYSFNMPEEILSDALNDPETIEREVTLLTYNKLRVTYGLDLKEEDFLVSTYRLYWDDYLLVDTSAHSFIGDIDFEDVENVPFSDIPNIPFDAFIGEILINFPKAYTCFEINGLRGPQKHELLITGMRKVADKVSHWLKDAPNSGKKKCTVSLGDGVKVKVESIWNDWYDWNDNYEKELRLRYTLVVDDDIKSSRSMSYYYSKAHQIEQYSSRMTYLDLLGGLMSLNYEPYLY